MTAPALDSKRFIRRLAKQDEQAFTHLVRAFQRKVFTTAFRMLGKEEDALDVSQEIFLSIFKALPRFRGDSSLSTWIYKITVNHCRNRLRRYKRVDSHERPFDDVIEATTEAPVSQSPEKQARGRQLEEQVQKLLDAMDPDLKELVILRDVIGLSYGEIGDVTGLKSGTIKSRLHRARVQLQESLEKVW